MSNSINYRDTRKIINISLFIFLMTCFYHISFAQTKGNKSDKNEILLSSDSWHLLTMPDGSGLYFDIIRAVYEPLGIRVKIKIVPYARSVSMVKEKITDGWVASFFNEQPFPLYPKWHFDRNKQIAVSVKNKMKIFHGIESIKNKNVIWLRGFNLDKYIKVPIKFFEIDDISSMFTMLDAGRADYFIGAESDIESVVKNKKIDKSKYKFNFLMYLKLYVAFTNNDKGKYFREVWDRQMEKLHNDPIFRNIYLKYNYPVPFE